MTLPIEQCLKPINADNKVGHDLRNDQSMDALYYQMKDVRNAARDLESRQAMGQDLDERADWNSLAKLCIQALSEQSKDLEVASWLVEAMLRLNGFDGMAKSLQLMMQLVEQYWGDVYPLPDEEGIETRLAPIVSLNGDDFDGTLINPIGHVAITEGNSCGPFALWQYQQAIDNAKITDKNVIKKKREEGSIFLDQIEISVAESSSTFYQTLSQDLQSAKQTFLELNTLLADKCGNHTPPQAKIVQALENFSDHIRFITKNTAFAQPVIAIAVDKAETQTAEDIEAVNVVTTSATNIGSLVNRDDALQQIGQLAHFFRQTQPQSPLPYLLERAQQLGRLSFPELLRELVSDDGARSAAYKLMGVEMSDDGDAIYNA
jgi:type VI secretion system protein ImpA